MEPRGPGSVQSWSGPLIFVGRQITIGSVGGSQLASGRSRNSFSKLAAPVRRGVLQLFWLAAGGVFQFYDACLAWRLYGFERPEDFADSNQFPNSFHRSVITQRRFR